MNKLYRELDTNNILKLSLVVPGLAGRSTSALASSHHHYEDEGMNRKRLTRDQKSGKEFKTLAILSHGQFHSSPTLRLVPKFYHVPDSCSSTLSHWRHEAMPLYFCNCNVICKVFKVTHTILGT